MGNGKRFVAKVGRAGPLLGLTGLGCAVDVIEYPDSDTIAAAAGVKNADLSTATVKVMGRVTPADYYEGEDGG